MTIVNKRQRNHCSIKSNQNVVEFNILLKPSSKFKNTLPYFNVKLTFKKKESHKTADLRCAQWRPKTAIFCALRTIFFNFTQHEPN